MRRLSYRAVRNAGPAVAAGSNTMRFVAYSKPIATRIRTALGWRTGLVEKKMFGGLTFLFRGMMLIGVLG